MFMEVRTLSSNCENSVNGAVYLRIRCRVPSTKYTAPSRVNIQKILKISFEEDT